MTVRSQLRYSLKLVIAFAVILAGTHGVCRAEGVRSVRQILELKDKWPLFAEAGTSFVIQGHLGSRTNAEIHMRHCDDLRFFLKKPDTDLPRRPHGETMVQLTGHFKYREQTPVFEIEKIEVASTFVQQHHSRSVTLNHRDADGWRKLAESTEAEAVFNRSPELHQLAKEAFERSCRIERVNSKNVTDEQMTGWIRAMKKFGVGQEVLDLWEHERLWMKWKSVRIKPDAAAMLRFGNELATSFPEARTPLELPQPKLDEAYQEDPQKVFAEADAERRSRLLRLFYMSVTRSEILLIADPDGKNADEIIERLKGSLPDDPDLINRYEDLWLSWRFSQLSKASREAAIALSQEYRERKLPEQARKCLENWLEARLENWSKEGPRGLVRASEEYLALLEDDQTAHDLLLKAWKLAPGEEDTKLALEKTGYRLYENRWITEKEFNRLPPDPIEEAIKQGLVKLEMTANQVKRAKGPASEIKTSVSAGQVSQAWIYGEPDTVRYVVHLLRFSHQPVDQARVIAIGEIRPQSKVRIESADESSPEEKDE